MGILRSRGRSILAKPGQEGGLRYQGTREELLATMRGHLHGGQLDMFDDDDSDEIGVVAGYGSGKTTADCYKAVKLSLLNPGCVGGVLEPTNSMVDEIWLPKFEEVLERLGIPYEFYRGRNTPQHTLFLPGGITSTVVARSFENYRRIVGMDWAWAIGDEVDTVKTSEAFKAYKKILGRIRAGNVRQKIMTSTPEGFGFHYQMYGSDEAQAVEGRRLIRMRSDDNPHLPADYFQQMERNYTAEELRAYREGIYINMQTGSVWYKFNRAKHVRPVEFNADDGETLILGCDFNIGNTNGIVQVKRGPVMYAIDEIRTHDTEGLCQEVRRRYPHATIHGYPDASGANRSTNSTRSDTNILAEYGIGNYSGKANPPVRDRVAVGNSRLENGKGEASIVIDPRCKGLIQDMERQCYDERGEPDKTNGNDHRCFTGDTLVATPAGPVRIDALPAAGLVIGPLGAPVAYTRAGLVSRSVAVAKLHLSNGAVVQCTPEHQILTAESGWKQAQHLKPGEALALRSWQAHANSSSRAWPTTSAATITSVLACASTAWFGRRGTAGRFLTAAMFTIETAIRRTTHLKTYAFSQGPSMTPSTVKNAQRLPVIVGTLEWVRSFWQRLLNGTAANRAEHGTASITTGTKTLFMPNGIRGNAPCAGPALPRQCQGLCIAGQRAPQKPVDGRALTMSSGPALCAQSCSPSTNTSPNSAAADPVALDSCISVVRIEQGQPRDVYCLTSAVGCFVLANGLVVGNCDAWSYPLHRIFATGKPLSGPVRSVRVY